MYVVTFYKDFFLSSKLYRMMFIVNFQNWNCSHLKPARNASVNLPLTKILDMLFYITFNSQGHIATGRLQVEETSAYCTLNHWASVSNCQLSNMKGPARDLNRQAQGLEAGTLTTTPPSPPPPHLPLTQFKLEHLKSAHYCQGT